MCLQSVLEDEREALYPDSDLVIDSKDGSPEYSVSELVGLRDGMGSVGGDMAGESLPRHFGQELGILSRGSTPYRWGPGFPVLILLGARLHGLSFVLETGSPLPMGWGCLSLGAWAFQATILFKSTSIAALP